MEKAKNGDIESSVDVMAKLFKMYYDALITVGFEENQALNMVVALQNKILGKGGEKR